MGKWIASFWLIATGFLFAQLPVSELESAYHKKPQNDSLKKQLALAYLDAGEFAKAGNLYKKNFDKRQCTGEEYKIYAAAQMLAYERSLILSKIFGDQMPRAEAALHEALKADPKDVEVQFLFGVFYRLKEDYDRSEMILQRIFDSSPDFHSFAFGNVTEELITVLQKQNKTEAVNELLVQMAEKNPDAAWPLIELAKQKIHADETEHAADLFNKGLDAADSALTERLAKEALWIADQTENENWKSLTDLDSKKQFLRSFWKKRDSNFADPANDRWAEHYRRLKQAQELYAAKRHHELDDRGIVYVRMGPPARILPAENWTAWFYEIDGSTLSFMFVDNGDGFYRIGSPVNATTGNNFGALYAIVSAMAEYDPAYQRLAIRMKGMQDGRVYRSPGQYKSSIESDVMQMSQQIVTEFAKREGDIDKQFYHFETGAPILEINANYACFRGENGRSRFDFYFMLPYEQLKFYPLADNEFVSSVTLNLSILDEQFNEIATLGYDEPVRAAGEAIKTQTLVDELRQSLKPGRYHVGFEVRNNDQQKIGVYKIDLEVPDYSADTLMVSDIQLAASVNETKTEDKFVKPRTHLRVVPNPAAHIMKVQPLSIYYEIYNLALGNDGRSRYEISYAIQMTKEKKSFFASALGVFSKKSKTKTAATTIKSGQSMTEFESIALDVSDLPEGEAVLEILVTDLLSLRVARSQIPLSLIR